MLIVNLLVRKSSKYRMCGIKGDRMVAGFMRMGKGFAKIGGTLDIF